MVIISNYDQPDNFLMCIISWILKQTLKEIYRQITILFEFELPYHPFRIFDKNDIPRQTRTILCFIYFSTFWK